MAGIELTVERIRAVTVPDDTIPLVPLIRATRSVELIDAVVERAFVALDEFTSCAYDENTDDYWPSVMLRAWMESLEGQTSRKLNELLETIYKNRDDIDMYGTDSRCTISDWAAYLMSIGPPSMRTLLTSHLPSLPPGFAIYAFQAMRACHPPARVFDECSPLFRAYHSPPARGTEVNPFAMINRDGWHRAITAGAMRETIQYEGVRLFEAPGDVNKIRMQSLDPRWGDLALKLDDGHLLLCCRIPGHPGLQRYWLGLVDEKINRRESPREYVGMLVALQHPLALDRIVKSLAILDRPGLEWEFGKVADLAAELDQSCLKELEARTVSLTESGRLRLESSLQALREKPNSNDGAICRDTDALEQVVSSDLLDEPLEAEIIADEPLVAEIVADEPLAINDPVPIVLDALACKGRRRHEIISAAIYCRTFLDERLVGPALAALDDKSDSIADEIMEQVIPKYGKAVVAELRRQLDVRRASPSDIRRLKLLWEIDPEQSRDLIRASLDGPSAIKAVAIGYLEVDASNRSRLVELCGSKDAAVRVAAISRLCRAGDPAVVPAVMKLAKTKELSKFVLPLRETRSETLRAFAIDEARAQLGLLLQDPQEAARKRFRLLLACLLGRQDNAATEFLTECFRHFRKLVEIGSVDEDVTMLLRLGSASAARVLVEAIDTLDGSPYRDAFDAARQHLPPEEFYRRFSPLIRDRPVGGGSEKESRDESRRSIIQFALGSPNSQPYWDLDDHGELIESPPLRPLDPRWLDIAVETEDLSMMNGVAHPNHPRANAFLSREWSRLGTTRPRDVLPAIMLANHPDVVGCIVSAMTANETPDSLQMTANTIEFHTKDLPLDTLIAFEKSLPSLPKKFAMQFRDAIVCAKRALSR